MSYNRVDDVALAATTMLFSAEMASPEADEVEAWAKAAVDGRKRVVSTARGLTTNRRDLVMKKLARAHGGLANGGITASGVRDLLKPCAQQAVAVHGLSDLRAITGGELTHTLRVAKLQVTDHADFTRLLDACELAGNVATATAEDTVDVTGTGEPPTP